MTIINECDCLECRIRAVIRNGAPIAEGTETFDVDIGDVLDAVARNAGRHLAALEALASIAGEVSDIYDAVTGKSITQEFFDKVNQARAYWIEENHIQMQRPVAGHC